MTETIEGQLVRYDEPQGMVMTTQEAQAELRRLQEFVHGVMKPGVDFGVIPGAGTKPTLLKPGAEKLNEIYGYAPELEVTQRVEEWGKTPPFLMYEVKVSLRNRHGRIVAEGIGSCNSMEVKYRYRNEYSWHNTKPAGDGWEQRTKKGENQTFWARRVINEETADIANTLLKMAKKRALIDATLSATRSSELFTQDVEDMHLGGDDQAEAKPTAKAAPREKAEGDKPTIKDPDAPASEKQIGMLQGLFKQKGYSYDRAEALLKQHYGGTFDALTKGKASEAIERLMKMPDAAQPEPVEDVDQSDMFADE
jgi:hypothetical protein